MHLGVGVVDDVGEDPVGDLDVDPPIELWATGTVALCRVPQGFREPRLVEDGLLRLGSPGTGADATLHSPGAASDAGRGDRPPFGQAPTSS